MSTKVTPLSSDDATEKLPHGAVEANPQAPEQTPEPARVGARARPDEARYRVREVVGRGGMGEVLRVEDVPLRRDVALKRVSGRDDDDEFRMRFVAEACIGGQLDHPAFLPVYDFGEQDDGTPYFTMKLVRGHQSLGDIMVRLLNGEEALLNSFTFKRRVQIIQQVCRAISYANQRGVVHRDLKPDNIVIGDFGEVYVVDWGVAHVTAAADTLNISGEVLAYLTRCDDEMLIGTVGYMSPEYLRNGDISPQQDVWSLAVILYQFLTLRHPFHQDPTPKNMLSAFDTLPPTPAESFRDAAHGRVPRSISQVLQKAFSARPEERFADCRALDEALQKWVEGAAPVVCPGTLIQHILSRSIYLIDQHPVLTPMVVIAVFCMGLSAATSWLLNIFF